MKMMKLLGAASTAALIAGAANAQLLLVQNDPNGITAGPDVAVPIEVAEEIDFALLSAPVLSGGDAATFGLEVVTQGQIPPGQNILLTVEVSNGVFAEALVDGTDYVVTGAAGAVVQAGGAIGTSAVQFLVTTDTGDTSVFDPTNDAIGLFLPIQMSSCGDVSFEVTQFETEVGGNAIEGGTAVLSDGAGTATPAVECVDAFEARLAVDGTPSTIDFSSGFTEFVTNADDSTTTAILGDFSLTVDTGVYVDLGSNFAAGTMTDGFSASIDFEDATGIDEGEAFEPGGQSLFDTAGTSPTGNSILLVGPDGATLDTETGEFQITSLLDTDFPIGAQAVTVSGATLLLDDTYLQASDPFLSADVEDLVFNGSTFGPFDWVADTNGRVNSIFRITGLSTVTSDIPSLLLVENSRNGVNGVFPFDLLASDVQGSEVRYVSSDLEDIAGEFGTADVTFIFGGTLDLDVDRLLSGPSTATVVPFGDNANSDPSGTDADFDTRSPTDDDDGRF